MKTQSFTSPGISWLQETRLLGLADKDSIIAAIYDWQQGGRKQNWIIDCSYVEALDQMSLLSGASYMRVCLNEGLHRIALVAPEDAAIAAQLIHKQTGIHVSFFLTREEAIRWYKSGCP